MLENKGGYIFENQSVRFTLYGTSIIFAYEIIYIYIYIYISLLSEILTLEVFVWV